MKLLAFVLRIEATLEDQKADSSVRGLATLVMLWPFSGFTSI